MFQRSTIRKGQTICDGKICRLRRSSSMERIYLVSISIRSKSRKEITTVDLWH